MSTTTPAFTAFPDIEPVALEGVTGGCKKKQPPPQPQPQAQAQPREPGGTEIDISLTGFGG